jgi:hypothetical protein
LLNLRQDQTRFCLHTGDQMEHESTVVTSRHLHGATAAPNRKLLI